VRKGVVGGGGGMDGGGLVGGGCLLFIPRGRSGHVVEVRLKLGCVGWSRIDRPGSSVAVAGSVSEFL